MKTYHLKDLLKKEVLIIELPEGYELAGVANGVIYYYDNHMNYEDYPLSILVEGSYTLLGKPDEIKEDDAKDLVEETEMGVKLDSKKYKYRTYNSQLGYKTAIESFLSALESEIYWINPLNNKLDKSKPLIIQTEHLNKWKEAQEKTFDKNRTLIFIKN